MLFRTSSTSLAIPTSTLAPSSPLPSCGSLPKTNSPPDRANHHHLIRACRELCPLLSLRYVKNTKTGEVGFETYINPLLSTRPAESIDGVPESVTWEQVETGEVPLSSFEDNAYINGYYVTDLIGYPTMLEARAEGAAGILLDFIKEHESHSAERKDDKR